MVKPLIFGAYEPLFDGEDGWRWTTRKSNV